MKSTAFGEITEQVVQCEDPFSDSATTGFRIATPGIGIRRGNTITVNIVVDKGRQSYTGNIPSVARRGSGT